MFYFYVIKKRGLTMKKNVFFTALFAAIFAALPSTVCADDLVNPFYGPEAKHLITKTSYTYKSTKIEDGTKEKSDLWQNTLYLGLGKSLMFYWDIYNQTTKPEDSKRYAIDYWDLGLGYFAETSENTSIDAELYYAEKKKESEEKYKFLYFYGRFDMLKDKDVKPFIGFEYTRGLYQIRKSDDWMNVFAGAWKRFGKSMLRLQGELEYDPNDPEKTTAAVMTEVGYQLSKNYALTASGWYTFYNHNVNDINIDHALTGQILLKWLF